MAKRDLDEWLLRVGEELERLSADFATHVPKVARSRAWTPRVDIVESSDYYVVVAEVSGVRPEAISVTFQPEDRRLLLKGFRHEEEISDLRLERIHQLEILYGDFERAIQLPEGSALDMDSARALLKGGFLYIYLKKAEAQPEPLRVCQITIHRL